MKLCFKHFFLTNKQKLYVAHTFWNGTRFFIFAISIESKLQKKTFGTINSTQKLMFSMTVIFSRGSNHCARWDYCNVFTFLFLCRNFQKKDFLHDRSLEKIKNVPFLAQHHSAIFSFCLIPFLILRMSKLCIV